jgi:hypothetical protein
MDRHDLAKITHRFEFFDALEASGWNANNKTTFKQTLDDMTSNKSGAAKDGYDTTIHACSLLAGRENADNIHIRFRYSVALGFGRPSDPNQI